MQPLFSGDAVKQLLPQREPVLMIDTLWEATATTARSALAIAPGNLFCSGGRFREPGLVENVAQTASALAGYNAMQQGRPAPVGYIGEVRKFEIITLPAAGSTLDTRVEIVGEVNGVSLLRSETLVDGTVVARGQFKIFIDG